MNVTSLNTQPATQARPGSLKSKDQNADPFALKDGKGEAKPVPADKDEDTSVAKPVPTGNGLSGKLLDVMALKNQPTDAQIYAGSGSVMGRTVMGDGKGMSAVLAAMAKDRQEVAVPDNVKFNDKVAKPLPSDTTAKPLPVDDKDETKDLAASLPEDEIDFDPTSFDMLTFLNGKDAQLYKDEDQKA